MNNTALRAEAQSANNKHMVLRTSNMRSFILPLDISGYLKYYIYD